MKNRNEKRAKSTATGANAELGSKSRISNLDGAPEEVESDGLNASLDIVAILKLRNVGFDHEP